MLLAIKHKITHGFDYFEKLSILGLLGFDVSVFWRLIGGNNSLNKGDKLLICLFLGNCGHSSKLNRFLLGN